MRRGPGDNGRVQFASFDKGDLVRQSDEGPVMSVSSVTEDMAYCIWFDGDLRVCYGTFFLHSLELVNAVRREPAALPCVAPSSLPRAQRVVGYR